MDGIKLVYKGVTLKFEAEQDWDEPFTVLGAKAQAYALVTGDTDEDSLPYTYMAEWLGVRALDPEIHSEEFKTLEAALDALIAMESDTAYDPYDDIPF